MEILRKNRPELAILVGVLGLSIGIGGLLASFALEKQYVDEVFLGYKGLLGAIIITAGFFCITLSIIFSVLIGGRLVDSFHRLKHCVAIWPAILEDWTIDPDSKLAGIITRIDDEQIIINYGERKYSLIFGGAISILFFLVLRGHYLSKGYFESEAGMGFAMLIPAFIALMYGIFFPKRKFIFDRMTGKATIPGILWFPSATVPFEKVRPGSLGTSMAFIHPYTGIPSSISQKANAYTWCFFVQYMDKNWPLSRGEFFDPYREKDFLRRKAEGFPKPKFPNDIHITDADLGYFYGTKDFKNKIKTFKVHFIDAYAYIDDYILEEGYESLKIYENYNDLALIGIYEDYYVFQIYYPQNTEYVILTELPENCFLCYGLKKTKKQTGASLVKEHGIAFERRDEWREQE